MLDNGAIVSVLNFKGGVGTSILTWSIAFTLELDIYQHSTATHHHFLKQRTNTLINDINVYPINKQKFKKGIYDLGSDINYPYVRQILNKSSCIVIPVEIGGEVIIKTLATIQYVRDNSDAKILLLFNKLDKSDPKRERKYTGHIKELILNKLLDNAIDKNYNCSYSSLEDFNITITYMRQSYSIFREALDGKNYLDHYISQPKPSNMSNFTLLRCLRYFGYKQQIKNTKTNIDISDIEKQTSFFNDFKKDYKYYIRNDKIFNSSFITNNQKTLKDMLILTTKIRNTYIKDNLKDDNEYKLDAYEEISEENINE
jgi:hypothetical protein